MIHFPIFFHIFYHSYLIDELICFWLYKYIYIGGRRIIFLENCPATRLRVLRLTIARIVGVMSFEHNWAVALAYRQV